ncbi:vesicle-associated membrane protein 7 [Rhodotorula toruloides]|uniref:Synaptobrevin homolog YKT6 n=1 Tax=Rhodotorula toruloides TaxID=5286 RepID=A0A511KKB4_RHOTO|nr:vesicle-associated membrane protein 7 [Rhodotorula toruloides]
MSLLHALVAREDTILAECDKKAGQYSNACQAILQKIPPNDSKLTYAADQILIHYQKKDGVTALVVAEDTAGRRMPFSFLAELHRRFTSTFEMPTEKMIAQLMQRYEENPPQDAIKAAQAELAATKDVMVKSIDAVLSRGERIEILVDRTDEMSQQARAFRKRATVLRRKMWYRNAKVLVAVGFSALLLMYLLLASACGIGLSHCRS